MKTTTAPLERSLNAWIGGALVGGVAGSLAKKDHRVLGAIGGMILGAIVVGAGSDVLIERYYAPKWQAARARELEIPPIWSTPTPS
jgi:hypothetical protein